MNEHDLRELVREAIARHTAAHAGEDRSRAPAPAARLHVSHGIFVLPTGADAGGPCLIEPGVMCNHCGYCTSYGH